MATTDTDALEERIARELFYTESPEERHRDGWLSAYSEDRYLYRDLAAAVLPIVAEEVRKAKAEALRETVRDMGEWAGEFILVTGDETDEDAWTSQAVGEWLEHRATEYETGDSDEHR